MPTGNIQRCIVNGVNFGMRGVAMCMSCHIERVQVAGGVFKTGGKENGGKVGKKGYIYSSSCNILVQPGLLVDQNNLPQPSSCTSTRLLMNEKPRDEIT
jgi:hypothetical protein